ncbi:MAG: thioredoxin fold domain-containing protein [Deltaproteobacteria bacterium]|nr:thioredoxin fold domain-containing protein [Deltaproteobacteria bacterium]
MNTGPYSDEKVRKFLQEQFIPLRSECFWDKPTEPMQRFGIKWTPTFLVLDPDGKEHHRFVGYVPSDDLIANLGLGKGKIFYDTDRMAEAIMRFQAVIDRHPNAGATPEAVFLLGVAGYKHSHDPKELRRAYETLKAKYPQSEWTRRADPYSAIPL